jgi:hypothetical protein
VVSPWRAELAEGQVAYRDFPSPVVPSSEADGSGWS